MGRKNDLSNLLSKKIDHSNRRRHNQYTPNFNAANSSSNGIDPKGKVIEEGLKSVGVPKGIAKFASENERVRNSVDKLTAQGTIKFPTKLAIVLPIVLMAAIPFIGLMLFVVLFDDSNGSSSYGSFALGQTCTTVTVVDTGCSGNATNCSHEYDGDVDFEDYVAGVVAAEVGSANNLEYYKVAALSARTFFLDHVGSDCTVKGNATFQAYMDVEDSSRSELIKQAVEETKGLVMVKDGELVGSYYASACVVNADEDYYYVRYGTLTLGEANFQKIPKEWDTEESVFRGYLGSWYSMVDKNDTDYENKSCPSNHDYGMSQIGALYLITGEDYDYEEVIKYYYGDDVEIMNNEMQLSGVEGFVNPTRYIYCSSPFGNRTHPVRGTQSFHTGIDIAISGGEPVYAAKSGTVTTARTNVSSINNCSYGYGNYIQIDHGDGTATLYAHLKYGSIPSSIYEGATVEQGEEIGQIGSTGCSTGNHLHYEVKLNGSVVDPADYLDLSGATGTCRR